MMGPLSHPGDGDEEPTVLRDHLDAVASRGERTVPSDATTVGGAAMDQFVADLGMCHDAGKATTWFQQYIDDTEPAPDGPTDHSLFGAYLAYDALEAGGYDPIDALAGFVTIARHHSRLPDTADYIDRDTGVGRWAKGGGGRNARQQDALRQAKDINEHASPFVEWLFDQVGDGSRSWDEFYTQFTNHDLFDRLRAHFDELDFDRAGPSGEFHDTVLQAWSALVFADKTSVAGAPLVQGTAPDRQVLVDRIDELPDEQPETERERRLNDARDEARKDVLESVDGLIESSSRVATLTLPTGLGKTLTGLDAAMKLRDETPSKRIVYALPFTSIIDQVRDDLTGIFETDATDDLLTVHHHLADTVIETIDDEEDWTDADANIATMLAESWRSGLTLTTFVQLFESLAGPGNTQSMKLPALYDSVIILDEPQALPLDWWKLVRRLIGLLVDTYDATVIAMTATQPRLFDDGFDGDPYELVTDYESYFERFDRVVYELHESVTAYDNTDAALDYPTAATELLDSLDGNATATLAVCDTIDSAAELTEAVTDAVDTVSIGEVYQDWLADRDSDTEHLAEQIRKAHTDETVAVAHLTTRHRPRDRLALIEALKELTDADVPLLVVSTQLIEAGVDISFDRVFRDLAPADSLVQAAGRCNRSFERDRGIVTLWWLAAPPDTDRTPAAAVYDRRGVSTVSETTNALDAVRDGETTLSEQRLTMDMVPEYYQRLSSLNPGNPAYVEFIENAEFEKLGSLSLIDTRRSVEVIVCRTKADKALVEDAREAWNTGRYDTFDDLVDRTKEMRVSVPVYDENSDEADALSGLSRLCEGSELRVLDLMSPRNRDYFDSTTGLVVPETTVNARFL